MAVSVRRTRKCEIGSRIAVKLTLRSAMSIGHGKWKGRTSNGHIAAVHSFDSCVIISITIGGPTRPINSEPGAALAA